MRALCAARSCHPYTKFSAASRVSSTVAKHFVQTVPTFDRGVKAQVASTAEMATTDAAASDLLSALRQEMLKADNGKGVHAYIVPSEDPHMSEYVPDCWNRRERLSKFTGSAGTAVVTNDEALLWTDGRYFLQAANELSKDWTLMKAGTPGCPDMEDWLAANLPEGGRVGIDPFCHTIDTFRRIDRKLQESGRKLIPLLEDGNLVDKVWKDRPAPPAAPVRVHPLQWAGETVGAKITKLREQMAAASCDVLLATMLDEVAWLFNLRGSDVDFNPVFISYGMITKDSATLFIDSAKLPDHIKSQLVEAGVEVRAYGDMVPALKDKLSKGGSVWMDPARVSFALYQYAYHAADALKPPTTPTSPSSPRGTRKRTRSQSATAGSEPEVAPFSPPRNAVRVIEQPSPLYAAKALKNPSELAGMKEAHVRDAVAICKFLSWFEKEVAAGRTFTEVDVDLELTGRRKLQQGFIEPSFPTIAGSGPNGAIIHYRAKVETARTVDPSNILLIDSGGQYDCGTTDITRTLHLGSPTPHQKRCFTRVLQGHIGLNSVVFPEGTPGCALDVLARTALWKEGLNYRHGTGHGVGAALNVHEGPHGIGMRYNNTTPLQVNMIVSNEPGYYEENAFGIRIENLEVIVEAETAFRYGGLPYFTLDNITVVPIQTKMMELSLLSPQEEEWVDTYHKKVWETVSTRLQDDPFTLDWLKRSTAPLREQLGTNN